MKRIYISVAVLLAVAITEGCMKKRADKVRAEKHRAFKNKLIPG